MKTHHLFHTLSLALAVAVVSPLFNGCVSTPTSASAGEYIDDTVLTARVKTALARDPVVNAFAVNVETFKQVVQLSGFVDSPVQKKQAERVAENVKGVTSVQNNITVKTEAGKTS